jgi:hypothetical protein
MDAKMMEAGGASKRVELFKLVKQAPTTSLLAEAVTYTEEESKVATGGDKGQGDYLSNAKRDRERAAAA